MILSTRLPLAAGFVGLLLWSASPAPALGQATGPTGPTAQIDAADEQLEQVDTAAERQMPRPALTFDVVAGDVDQRIDRFISQMTLAEKVGQLVQVYPADDELPPAMAEQICRGEIGSVFYPGNRSVIDEAQRIAVGESRLGIPLLIARDVVHGLRTVFPIPLGQAATWNPRLVEQGAIVAAAESKAEHIDWTFAPMVDICRDARWGRIAETLGEDPVLAGELGAAMVRGFQQEQNGKIHGVIACPKHFVGYGFSEGGRDYNRVSVSQTDLHNIVLPPFRRSIDAGARTLMTTFSSVNGVPGTAHQPMLRDVLKRDWDFSGFVVSDWASITEMVAHGFVEDNADAAEKALMSGVDMDMCSPAFSKNLARLVREGRIPEEHVDDAVRRVLRCKVDLAERRGQPGDVLLSAENLEVARETVRQSIVLLKNQGGALPLDASDLKRVAVIGPMADAPQQQLGCWSLDGKADDSVTPLAHLRDRLEGVAEVRYSPGVKNTFSEDDSMIAEAAKAASDADVALLFVGEDAVLSGEARCRTTLNLPGVQTALIDAVAETGVPTVVVFLAGRPLTIEHEVEVADAVMYAWHPGTMAGPALGDLLFGDVSPSGKLPVTFPRSVGQTPLYYNHPNTGRPSSADFQPLFGSDEEDLPPQYQYRSHYLDEDHGPHFPFGYGLSYTTFEYDGITASQTEVRTDGSVTVAATVTNAGDVAAAEVVQLYTRDVVASSVRPVRELKSFRRLMLKPGESRKIEFLLDADDFAYFDTVGKPVLEPGKFQAWIGGDSTTELSVEFTLLADETRHLEQAPQLPTATAGETPIR